MQSDALRPAQNALVSDLHARSELADPTPFHSYLARLENESRLLRCYTQNIDGLEGKVGLSVGILAPAKREGRKKRKLDHDMGALTPLATPEKPHAVSTDFEAGGVLDLAEMDGPHTPRKQKIIETSSAVLTPTSQISTYPSPSSTPSAHIASDPTSTPTSVPVPVPEPIFRVIPLHGQLTSLRCTVCPFTAPIASYLPLPSFPDSLSESESQSQSASESKSERNVIPCPDCSTHASIRSALSERQRPSGFLRPDIVLYGEEHREGHNIGAVVERDLKGLSRGMNGKKEGKADLVLVAGTSLSIPGVKRMIKEFAKSLSSATASGSGGDTSLPTTPTSMVKRRASGRATDANPGAKRTKVKVVYVNDEPPSRSAEWEGVFDHWVKGDVQRFITDYIDDPSFPSTAMTGGVATKMAVVMATPPKTPKTPKSKKNGLLASSTSTRAGPGEWNDADSPIAIRNLLNKGDEEERVRMEVSVEITTKKRSLVVSKDKGHIAGKGREKKKNIVDGQSVKRKRSGGGKRMIVNDEDVFGAGSKGGGKVRTEGLSPTHKTQRPLSTTRVHPPSDHSVPFSGGRGFFKASESESGSDDPLTTPTAWEVRKREEMRFWKWEKEDEGRRAESFEPEQGMRREASLTPLSDL